MQAWKESLLRYIDISHSELVKEIAEKKELTEESEAALHEAIKTFNSTWQ
jgi:F0F1-type ATP synthase alpha subunit